MHSMIVPVGGGLDRIVRVEREEPTPGPGEVAVRIRAASLNFHDYVVAMGRMPYIKTERVPLSDGAGEVVSVGPGVVEHRPGDRVVSQFFPAWRRGEADPSCVVGVPGDHVDGVAQDVACLPAQAFAPAPPQLSDAEAATLPCAALTAWRALVTVGKLAQGEVVLLQGTGGVSIFGLQLAKAAGARVIITSSSDDKLARARSLGADETINYRQHPEWAREVMRLTGGRGADHVLEIGGGETFDQSIRACAMGGHIAVVGIRAGYQLTTNPARIFSRNLRLTGITVGSRQEYDRMCRAITHNGIRPVISLALPMSDLAAAFRAMEAGTHFGKIVVTN